MAIVAAPEAAGAAASDSRELIASPKEGSFVELPSSKNAADVIISFGPLQGHLAFWVESTEVPNRRGPVNCLPAVPTEAYVLPGLPEGPYRLHAALWEPSTGTAAAAQPSAPSELEADGPFQVRLRASRCFHVRRFADFSPSYDWQAVEPLHRLPPGLEITMDLSASDGGRRARIPQPWQWDARVEGEVQRVPVEADATVASLLELLGLSPATHEAVWRQADGKHERVLEVSWTARQADLFRYSKDIIIRAKLVPSVNS